MVLVDKQTSMKKNIAENKGRQLDESALRDVVGLIGEGGYERPLLIEYLHAIQDHYGHISARHMRALAELLRIGQAEVYEVASFYDHFDFVREGATPPAPLTLRVCDSVSCMMAGAEELIAEIETSVDASAVRVLRAPCMGRCACAPAARVGDREVDNATCDGLLDHINSGNTDCLTPDYRDLSAYRADGGYKLFGDIVSGQYTPEALIEILSASGLRGLGGAGFPAGQKWSIVRSFSGSRLMTVNADEGEPGTFKDRYYLEQDPHRMLEGALIAGYVVEAEAIYIYLRDEYPAVRAILTKEIKALVDAKVIDEGKIVLRRGAGAYICGEESAMIESIEGKRGLPRHRPPFIAEVGLFGKPTLNHNVETLYWLRDIIEKGVDWFRDQGTADHPGFRSYSVSGKVKKPGVVMAPAGTDVKTLINDYCGGMLDGHALKAYLPGGASGGVLPASLGNLPLDFGGKLAEVGAFVGSHAIVVLSDKDSVRDVVINLMSFFKHESCGQCTPCRAGTEKMLALLKSAAPLDEVAVGELEQVMRDASICGLGQAAPNPVRHLLTYFRQELQS